MKQKNFENLISVRDAASILGLTTKRVYQLIHEGKLMSVIISKIYFVYRKDVENYK